MAKYVEIKTDARSDQTRGKEHLHMRRDADYTIYWLVLASSIVLFCFSLDISTRGSSSTSDYSPCVSFHIIVLEESQTLASRLDIFIIFIEVN